MSLEAGEWRYQIIDGNDLIPAIEDISEAREEAILCWKQGQFWVHGL